jgi:hypothetical protein
MAKTLQFKRYTTSVVANTIGANGELIVDSNTNTITVHDGVKSGGWYTANAITLQSAFIKANAAYEQANTDLTYLTSNVALISGVNTAQNNLTNLVFSVANTAIIDAAIANTIAISSGLTASAAWRTANNAASSAVVSGSYANSAYTAANSATVSAAISGLFANLAFEAANSAGNYSNSAFTQANVASTTIPQNRRTTNYVLSLTDAGKHLYYQTSSNVIVYIPTTSNVAFSNGQTVMIVSATSSAANVVVTPNTGVSLYAAGNTISGNHNVTTYGVATLMQVSANTWFISGTGVV